MRKAFTLIEVNLAMLIMAGGILSIVGLYAYGFRENRQSREDVASAAMAETVMSPLVSALSSTNLLWSKFKEIKSFPGDDGWGEYDTGGNVIEADLNKASGAFDDAMTAIKGAGLPSDSFDTSWPSVADYGLIPGLVILHDQDSPIVRIGFRATRNKGALMSQPLYFTEVRFQGLMNQ